MSNSPTSPALIRPARIEDAPAILNLIAELAEFENLSDQLIATVADLEASLFGENPAAEALVAESPDGSGELVGYAIFFSTFSTFIGRAGIWLEDIYIRPDFRGQKIGKVLLQAVAKIARDRNAGRLEWSVLDWNQRAIDFYEHIGADVMPEWRICRLNRDGVEKFAGTD